MAVSIQVARIESSEDLRECTQGSDIEIVRLKAGKQQGSLTHLGIGNLAMTLGRFTLEVRARGVIHPDRVTLGMLLTSAGRVSHWGHDVQPGDVCIYPPGVDHDGIYGGGATYAAVSKRPRRSLCRCSAARALWRTQDSGILGVCGAPIPSLAKK
jgi:hypothetical protein